MDFKHFADDPLFWALICFAAALLIIWINRYSEESKLVKLFTIAPPPSNISWIPYQYVHFGLKIGCDPNLRGPNIISIATIPLPSDVDSSNSSNGTLVDFTCNTQSCECCESDVMFVNLKTITEPTMPTEAGSPPRSTISHPTGTGSGGSEGFDLNIIINNQCTPVQNVLDYVIHLPLAHINSSTVSIAKDEPYKIAIIDTGLIGGNYKQNIDPIFYSGSVSVCEKFNAPDVHGHGTFVYYFLKAGLHAQNITNYEIYPYNVANANGDIELGNALCAIVDAASHGVKTINLSFGLYEHWEAFEHFFNILFSQYPYLKVVCSAGNNNLEIITLNGNTQLPSNQGMPHPPSYYNNVFQNNIFQITALEANNIDNGSVGAFWPFTNYEVGANIGCQGSYIFNLNGQDCLIEGTSFAAPFFAGYYASHNNIDTRNSLLNIVSSNSNFAPPNYFSIIPFSNYIP
jgi:Subtilase family